MGDVAIDDILVTAGGCAVSPAEAAREVNYVPPSIQSATVAPLASTSSLPLGPHDCTFEQDLCSWSSTIDDVRTGIIMGVIANSCTYYIGLGYLRLMCH